MKMVQSIKVKCANSTYKENITSVITPSLLVGEIQRIKKALWESNNKFKNYLLAGIHYRMCFLMDKYGILCGKSLFRCELSYFWYFVKIDEEPYPLYCVVMAIFQGGMNPNRALYGSVCRSVNERLFPVGAILMYLFIR